MRKESEIRLAEYFITVGSLGPNCPAGHGSFVTVLESAQNYICKMIRKIQTENILSLEVKASVVKEYNEHVHKWLQRTHVSRTPALPRQ